MCVVKQPSDNGSNMSDITSPYKKAHQIENTFQRNGMNMINEIQDNYVK